MNTILLTGANGQVGWELRRALAPLGKVIALDSQLLDLADADAIRERVRDVRPHIIVNPAAYTAVDKAESEAELARAINGIAPGILAEEAKKLDALLVHYSTDYVFDGKSGNCYDEDHTTAPQNVYGQTKLEGELAICSENPEHLIFRTSWVYGVRGKNFLKTIIRLGRDRDHLSVVSDQSGAPTWCRLIAEATALAISRYRPELSGIYHLTNASSTTWHGFAQAIVDGYAARCGMADWPALRLASCKIEAIRTEQYPTPARRPANSVMNTAKFRKSFGLELPDWNESLELVLDDLASQYLESKD